MELSTPKLEHICNIKVELGSVKELGDGRGGKRRIIPIIGGTVTGDALTGRVLNIGADWQTVFDDGLAQLDTRYALETDDGAIIEILNFGFRHGSPAVLEAIARGEDVPQDQYYMRTHAQLETGDHRYEWVNRALFIGTGARLKSQVLISLFQIL
ncbi:DUF3237 domain-containing protein [Alphaproteobacteria bacterium]|nr:DUF3237 domain-containing protein [Alphaproteobacteria bacterium]